MVRAIVRSLVLGGFVGVLMFGCARYEDDITFAKRTMEQLIEGRYAARTRIDWPNLKIMGRDVGRQYSQFKKENERVDYAHAFIKAFSESYKGKGAKASAFFGWRPSEFKFENTKYKVVASYCYDKNTVFLFFISDDKGRKKLAEMMVLMPKDLLSSQGKVEQEGL